MGLVRRGNPVGPSPAPVDSARFIQTVRGPVDAEEIGPTLVHEHLAVDWDVGLGQHSRQQTVRALDRIEACCNAAATVGVECIVDCGTEQFGTSNELLAAAAKLTPVHVVCATGIYCADALPAPAWAYLPTDPEKIAAELVREAREGRSGSGVRPGVFKIGTSGRAITGLEERVFEGAAIAQAEAGLALTTHTEETKHAEEQVEILERSGADLERVIIGHIGWGSAASDRELHRRLADRGVALGLDMVGYDGGRPLEEWASMIGDLVRDGHAERIVLSHDQAAYASGVEGVFDGYELSGDFTVVSSQLVPLLESQGIDQAQVERFLVHNPRRILGIHPRHRDR